MGSNCKAILAPPTSYISSSSAFLTYSCSACFKERPKEPHDEFAEQDDTDELLRKLERNTFEYALKSNEAWANYKGHQNPAFFEKLASGQSPSILWLGCSDSRVPETTLLGLQPGDVFAHRNIANIISPTDINSMAVIEYAVVHLKVKHIVLCGHTCCGGANAALGDARVGGIIDAWITPLRTLRKTNEEELKALGDDGKRAVRLAELNVETGVGNLMGNWIVEEAVRERGLTVHGVLYDVACGKIGDLQVGTAGSSAATQETGGCQG
ncbi:related to carbonic anhydrase [Rhynchosporium agropyri]|uniref:Carbonic anhydrase n=1 Tax=Rhynchosporium agropyri TaxID=914238 RepID=A0A1E1LMQ2_9HELO|nr:related to carbonic anhydrase [Rhynchosporium agropyri]